MRKQQLKKRELRKQGLMYVAAFAVALLATPAAAQVHAVETFCAGWACLAVVLWLLSAWTQLAQTANNDDFHWVNDLIMSSHDSQRLYAATRTGIWRSRVFPGLWLDAAALLV